MTAALWDEWAEMSITHRDVRDPDVAAVLRLVQREAETDRLRADSLATSRLTMRNPSS
ncbi:MAG TPA: hypothetical protein VGF22_05905 [Acidimicrobiales bacterium]|jgi:hypothetical protein